MRERVMRLEDAAALVQDGSTIGVGGFGVSGHPMVLLAQLVRQGVRDLTLLGITNGNDADVLIGAAVSVVSRPPQYPSKNLAWRRMCAGRWSRERSRSASTPSRP